MLTSPTATGLRKREAGENFPVALAVLPRRHRRALHAVYAFARSVDDTGDEAAGDRVAMLQAFDEQVARVWAGGPSGDRVVEDLRHAGVTALAPEKYFHDLVHANLHDQLVGRYPTFDALVGYCRLSADPVGRIVLALFGRHDADLLVLSDRVCTALQLLEHWQDVGEDRRRGRVYLPIEDLLAYGVPESDLDASTTSPALARLMRFEVERAAGLLAQGAPLVGRLRGWARCCVAGYVGGGQATVAALRRAEGDVLGRAPRPSRVRTAALSVRLLARGVRRWSA